MGKDIFDSILEKKYDELSSQELTEISPFCSDEQSFLAMKEVLNHTKSISSGPKLTPQVSNKETLDAVFNATYGQTTKKAFYLQPLFQVAAALLIGFAVWLFVEKNPGDPIQLAEHTEDQQQTNVEEETPLKQEIEEQEEEIQKVFVPKMEHPANDAALNLDHKIVMQQNEVFQEMSVQENVMTYTEELASAKKETTSSAAPTAVAKSSYRTQSVAADYISSNSDSNPFALKVVYSVPLEKQLKVLDFLVPHY